MLQIVTHTPIWVFVLFFCLLAFGVLQSRNRHVRRIPAYLLPLGMVGLSLSGVQASFGLKPLPVACWAIGLCVATLIGYRYFRETKVSFNREKGTFFIPGSWAPLLVIMAIFFSKYALAVMASVSPALLATSAAAIGFSAALGAFSGYFAARALNLYICAQKPAGSAVASPLSGN